MWSWSRFVSFFIIIIIIISVPIVKAAADCQVMVHEPWPTTSILVPNDSYVIVNCSSNSSTLFWLVSFSNESGPFLNRFSSDADILNDRGVYELSRIETPGMTRTLRLLINDTSRNNQTELFCRRENRRTIYSTTLFVFKPQPFSLEILNTEKINAVIISWSHDSSVPVSDSFLLTVSRGSSSEVVTQTLSESFYYFNVSDSSPPCDVYNFSVTASYITVGVTYTGAGCNITGSRSMMLPSLPNLSRLEPSLKHVLIKTSSNVILTVSFESASYCEQYPVRNYTLEVKGPSSEVINQSVSPQVEKFTHNLTENTIYKFRVSVSNSVGIVSTNYSSQLYTADVQNVTATLIETMNAVEFQCDFITGSDAQGCMVVLVGELDNVTSILERTNPCRIEFFNLTNYSMSTFSKVFAFDIESDGSVGTLAVPGAKLSNNSVTTPCPSTATTVTTLTTSTSDAGVFDMLIAIVCGGVAAGIVLMILLLCIIIAICYKIKRSKNHQIHNGCHVEQSNCYSNEPNCIEFEQCTDEELELQAAETLYDQPIKALERSSGDGGEIKHIKDQLDVDTVDGRETNTYAELADLEEGHQYHTLEPHTAPQGIKVADIEPDPDAPALPPPYRPPSPSPEQPPDYQDISSQEVTNLNQATCAPRGEYLNVPFQSSPTRQVQPTGETSSETLL